ncbi:hypothetical protein ECC02_006930 [Trypanosoma cruzi]|uniref:Uncharacterized protein n=1 Tax=Trypanosoma cruzi TaxID=5693 RepID=A0A7J6Y0B9_TRYCR|nr:hypothetical protein ECC02_006930 [Trypanosoma cruzi]
MGCSAVMSFSGLLLAVSVMRLRCTFRASFHILCSLFSTSLLCASAGTHTQDAHCSGYECSFCSACWQLRVAAVFFFRGHEEKGGGSVQPESLSCGCDAPRVTALSWTPCPIEGGMAGNFLPRHGWMRVRLRVWLLWWVLAPCALSGVAGIPGHVSGDADAVVVRVDVSFAPSDGSLSYRVCVCGRGESVLLPVLRLSMRTVISVALMCACTAEIGSWVLCAMWPMRCTHVATVLPAVQRRRKGPPLPSR